MRYENLPVGHSVRIVQFRIGSADKIREKKMRKLLLVVAILLSGCMPPKQFVMESPDRLASDGSDYQGKATLYVFRENNFANGAWSLEVKVDDVCRTSLRAGTYASFPVEPGKRQILYHWLDGGLSMFSDMQVEVEMVPDKTYYFTYVTDAHVVVNSGPSTFKWALVPISRQDAEERISTFRRRDVE